MVIKPRKTNFLFAFFWGGLFGGIDPDQNLTEYERWLFVLIQLTTIVALQTKQTMGGVKDLPIKTLAVCVADCYRVS